MDQTQFFAGDSLNYTRVVPGYVPGDGWWLRYRLAPRSAAAAVIDITATPSGDEYLVQVAPTTTANWTPGMYTWASWVERAGERYSIAQGQLEVLPNPATLAAGVDTRSVARRTLDDLIAARATWVTTQGRVRRYRIGEREREFVSAADLDREIHFWEQQLQVETTASNLAAGIRPKSRILTRFTRTR